jgi:membrane protease YdiL (CAAX protease family)
MSSLPLPARLWRRHVTAHLDAIDAARQPDDPSSGRLPARTRSLWVFVVGALVLTAMSYGVLQHSVQQGMAEAVLEALSAISSDLGAAARPYADLIRMAMWTVGAFCMYVVLPALVIRVVFRERLTDFGMNARDFRRHLPIYALLFLPVAILVLVVAAAPDFQAKYPFYKRPLGPVDFVAWELLYVLQFFSLEFFFRGFLVHGLKDRLGSLAAFAMVAPYVMIHFGKPLYETLGAILAGSVLGVLSLRTGSIAGGVAIHGAVAVMMDVAAMAYRGFPW